ncbi:universal stress protein [Capilliphycus salinus ALCB114379]|uniref:universal stress protein n=1 Tax=Capilliphycus salinus TaxID=2768948 RepID=UPI0039A6C06E
MYSTILVPLDGSERAETIIPYVEQLAQKQDVHVVFTQVIEPTIRSAILNLEKEREVAYPLQNIDQVQHYLMGWKHQFKQRGLSADILLLRGVAVEGILQAVNFTNADLVAMTSQGKTGLARTLYGSVTSGVLNKIHCPLFVVQSKQPEKLSQINQILIPLDCSYRAEKAIDHATTMAQLYEAKIILLHVVRTGYQTTAIGDLDSEITEESVAKDIFNRLGKHQEVERIKQAREYLLNIRSELQEQDLTVEVHLMYGRPIESIITLANDLNVDLVTMTNQGRTGLSQVLYGSVASGILNGSNRPLLIVPT